MSLSLRTNEISYLDVLCETSPKRAKRGGGRKFRKKGGKGGREALPRGVNTDQDLMALSLELQRRGGRKKLFCNRRKEKGE